MIPVLFTIGPISLYSFGAMLALAFLAASALAVRNLESRGLDGNLANPITWYAVIGGILGSRFLSIYNNWDAFLAAPFEQLFTGAGFVFFGGLAGGFVAVSAWVLAKRIPWLVIVDVVAPAIVLGQAIGRIGCQLAGDGDWGVPTELPWGMAYPDAYFGWTHAPGVLVHPAPVYESLLYSGIFVLLMQMFRHRERWADGGVMFAFLGLSGAARYLVETIRIEPLVYLDLTQGQLVGISMMFIGACGVFYSYRGRGASGPLSAAVLVLTLAGCMNGAPTAPEFLAQDLSGKAFRLSAQRGKVVLLNIFTTWCPPCREEMPSMQRLAEELATEDFLIVGVAEDDGGAPVVRSFGQELGIRFPLLTESTGSVGVSYQISGYPETFVIGRDGKQLARIIGPLQWDEPEMVSDLRHLIQTGEWLRGPDGRR